jgi:hypothetical protein
MIARVNDGLIKRCAMQVSQDLKQSEQLMNDEVHSWRSAVLAGEWS